MSANWLTTARRIAGRPLVWLAVLVVGASTYVGFLAQQNDGPKPFLKSTEPNGGLAFVRLAERLNVKVEAVGRLRADQTLFILNSDTPDPEEMSQFVRNGGTVVLGAPSSPFLQDQEILPDGRHNTVLEPQCAAPWTRNVGRARVSLSRSFPVIKPAQGDVGCFPAGKDTFFAVDKQVELGRVITLGSDALFTNELIDENDNAVLVANLIGADQGGTVQVFDSSMALETGLPPQKSLMDFVPTSVWMLLVQVAVVFFLLALLRGRRLSRIASESVPVALPASSLVVAQGELFDLSNETNATAKTLRRDCRRKIAHLVGVDPSIDVNSLVATVAGRTGLDARRLRRAMVDSPITSGQELLELSQEVERLHQEVVSVR